LEIPADLSADVTAQIQDQAIKVFQLLCCEGMARVDFFITEDNQIYVNEINTIPGFTDISMYPMLWKASGISYAELVDTLIQLAIERSKKSGDC
jgi:D-alanine-D-alanine ligase